MNKDERLKNMNYIISILKSIINIQYILVILFNLTIRLERIKDYYSIQRLERKRMYKSNPI